MARTRDGFTDMDWDKLLDLGFKLSKPLVDIIGQLLRALITRSPMESGNPEDYELGVCGHAVVDM
jgi:hypothetical protein